MEEKKGMPGWLKGCLTGCGVLTIVVLLLLTFVCMKLRGVVREVQHAEQTFEQLADDLGDYREYAPAGEVSLAAERVELFLRIREEMAEDREALSMLFRDFPVQELKEMDRQGEPPPVMVWTVMKRFASLINPVGEFIATRNEILLREGMPLGEYSWIYSLSF